MRVSKILTAMVAAALVAAAPASAIAATAHNSQAGAWGGTKNTCAPTPYFQEGGCLRSFLTGTDDGEVFSQPGSEADPYRQRPPLRALDR